MIGEVGNAFGAAGVNIISAAVGLHPEDDGGNGEATMVVTADAAVPETLVEQITGQDGFVAGRSVNL